MAYKGVRKIVIEYEIDGERHTYKSSEGNVAVNLNLGIGDAVTVYVHPIRHKRAVVVWNAPAKD
jgi:hypothetical protein